MKFYISIDTKRKVEGQETLSVSTHGFNIKQTAFRWASNWAMKRVELFYSEENVVEAYVGSITLKD